MDHIHQPYKVKKKMDIVTYEVDWQQFPLEDYPVVRPMFYSVGIFQHTVGKDFIPNPTIEDCWLNYQDD